MKKTGFVWIVIMLFGIILFISGCGCDHEIVIDAEVEATCTENGLSEGKHCALCGKVLAAQKEIKAYGHKKIEVDEVAATCITSGTRAGEICSVCDEVISGCESVAALGHTTDIGVCDRCNESFGIWTIEYYVDSFKQPTSEGYVVNMESFSGVFSNSATKDSKLNVELVVDKNNIAIFLYEYEDNLVKESFSNCEYTISIRKKDGSTIKAEGIMYEDSDRIFILNKYENTVLNLLKSGEELLFYIADADRPITNYLFSVQSSNFAEQYSILNK